MATKTTQPAATATAEPALATSALSVRKPPREGLTAQELLRIPQLNPAYRMDDFLLNMIGRDIGEKKKVLLTGHMGCGKTTLFLQIAAMYSQPVVRVNLNGQTTISDLVGYNTVIDGNVVWIDGLLTLAVRYGWWIILDEIDGAEASVLMVINALAEKDGVLTLKEKGSEILVPHEKFRMLATANTVGKMEKYRHVYQGTQQMSAALIDRFRVYYIDYLGIEDEIKVVSKTVPNCPEGAARPLVELAHDLREGFKNEQLALPFSLRALIDLAEMLIRIRDIEKGKPVGTRKNSNEILMQAVELCIYSKVGEKDAAVIEQMVSKIAIT